MRVRSENDLVFCEKATGFNTHAPAPGKDGLVERLSADLGRTLHVVHRLDQGTSGAMVFAATKEAAAELAKLFESRSVSKRYLFLTTRRRDDTELEASSFIDKKGNAFVSDPGSKTPNAITRFRRLKRLKLGDLWEALPETGKPHQIRLHAADLGMPILGDADHGGAPFGRLCLHSKVLEFPWRGGVATFEAANPVWVNDLDGEHILILDAVQARSAMFDLSGHPEECLRLCHLESDLCRIDQYGLQVVVSWYAERDPSPADLKLFEILANSLSKSVFVRKMQNKGEDPNTRTTWNIGQVAERWTALENGVRYEFRLDSGQSPGLFLDQRENRLWTRANSSGKKVLNLFSYTGGFSVNAGLGGASEICTVDLSAKFNDWAGENFRLNGLDVAAPSNEFWAQDCMLFLKGAAKRRRRWDLILCDPPSFGRSKEGVFQVHKHLPQLLELCLSCLEKGGKILLSSNYEGWNMDELRRQVFVYRSLTPIDIELTPPAGLDFERPGEEPLMKSLLIVKK